MQPCFLFDPQECPFDYQRVHSAINDGVSASVSADFDPTLSLAESAAALPWFRLD